MSKNNSFQRFSFHPHTNAQTHTWKKGEEWIRGVGKGVFAFFLSYSLVKIYFFFFINIGNLILVV